MIIKPYSAIAEETFVAADFPALAHAFFFDEGSGSSCTCAVTGLTINDASSTAITYNADGTVNLTANKNVITTGTVASPGTKKVLLMSIGKPAAAAGASTCRFGDVTTGTSKGFVLTGSASATTLKATDGTNAVSGLFTGANANLVGDGSTWQARCAVVDWGNAAGLYQADYAAGGAWAVNDTTPVDLSASTGFESITQSILFGSGLNPSMVLVWYLDAVPADYKAALLWQLAMAQAGTKAVYPGYKGRS